MVKAAPVEYVPLGQAVQAPLVAPDPVPYAPAPQSQHAFGSWIPFPVKNLPLAQSWHTALDSAPTVLEYWPGPHHVQLLCEVIPTPVE